MSSSTWQQHFQDRLTGFKAPEEGSALEAALAEGLIEEADYLAWASQEFGVPVVMNTFFTEHEPDPELLGQRKVSWQPQFFPISAFDGFVTIAALEVPKNALPANCVVALAGREALANWWEKLAPHVGQDEALEGITLDAGTGEPTVAPESEPEGLTVVSAAAPLNFSFAGVQLNTAAAASVPEAAPEPAPIEEKHVVDTDKTARTPSLEALNTQSGLVAKDILAPTMKSAPAAVPTTAEMPVRAQKSLVKLHGDPKKRSTLSPVVASQPKFIEEVRKAMGEITTPYEKMMLMGFDESRKSLIPLLWTESFGQPATPSGVALGQASIFEIVATTEKPFHGRVVENEINKGFFAIWNEGRSPETATLVPFFFRNQLSGVLVAFGSSEADNLPLLRKVEKVAQQLANQLGGTNNNRAAA